MSNDATWQEWRDQIGALRYNLREDVAAKCPGVHHPQQHRDGRLPWCNRCGRTIDGVLTGDPSPDPAKL